jgi:hypothetical protein
MSQILQDSSLFILRFVTYQLIQHRYITHETICDEMKEESAHFIVQDMRSVGHVAYLRVECNLTKLLYIYVNTYIILLT